MVKMVYPILEYLKSLPGEKSKDELKIFANNSSFSVGKKSPPSRFATTA